jgi:hypothetical protein
MPYKSQAQQAKFHQLLKEGKISKKVVKEWDKESKGLKLPKKLLSKSLQQRLAQKKK